MPLPRFLAVLLLVTSSLCAAPRPNVGMILSAEMRFADISNSASGIPAPNLS